MTTFAALVLACKLPRNGEIMNVKIVQASYHRNGICGVGFYAILFDYSDEGGSGRMIASLFDEPGYCAVYKVDLLAENDAAFGSNSWRGDQFEDALRPALYEFLQENGTNRVGPFAL